MFVNGGMGRNEPLGMGGSWPEGSLVASSSGLVRMEFPTEFGRRWYILDSFGKCDRKQSFHNLAGICPSWVTLRDRPSITVADGAGQETDLS